MAVLDSVPISEALAGCDATFAEAWWHWFSDPRTVTAMLEDYRAGLGIDRGDEEADRAAGRTIASPVLLLWSTRDDLESLYGDPLTVWRGWSTDLRGHSIDSGHHMAEEAPEQLAASLTEFFT